MSSLSFVVFDTTTGEILRTGVCQMGLLAHQVDNVRGALAREAVMVAEADDQRDYVDLTDRARPVVRPRGPLPCHWSAPQVVADGESEIVLADLPLHANVTMLDPLGRTMRVEHDGTLEFSCTIPGAYRFTVAGPRWVPSTFEIEGIAA